MCNIVTVELLYERCQRNRHHKELRRRRRAQHPNQERDRVLVAKNIEEESFKFESGKAQNQMTTRPSQRFGLAHEQSYRVNLQYKGVKIISRERYPDHFESYHNHREFVKKEMT